MGLQEIHILAKQKPGCSKDSRYRDWYVWSDTKPANAHAGMVFPGVQKSTWTRDKEAGAWYFHRFYDFQPDLSTSNPHVQAEILKIMGFWIQLGVSGFRMDAVPFIIATKGPKVRKPVEQYDMLRSFREFLQWRKGDSIICSGTGSLKVFHSRCIASASSGLVLINTAVFCPWIVSAKRSVRSVERSTRATGMMMMFGCG